MKIKSQPNSVTSFSQDCRINLSLRKAKRIRFAAFTLMELLTAISIIALLAAVLFPVFVSSREKARSSTCLSNLRQLGLALRTYSEDYDGVLPLWQFNNHAKMMPTQYPSNVGVTNQDGLGRPVYFWMTAIYPYVKDSRVYLCPSAPNTLYSAETGKVPYGLNVTGEPYSTRPCIPVAGGILSDIPRPTETALLMDGGPIFGMDGDKCKEIDNVTLSLSARHSGGVNVAFVDGHAQWMAKRTILADIDRWIIP